MFVPTSFTEVVLIPILKKPSSNPALPNSYRPIVYCQLCFPN